MNDTETFQHYQVLRREDGSLWELGRGAMGVTYKAFDVNLRCHVALKVINAQYLESETARARFLREARAAAGLRHRNVASVYHLGNDAESFFYSMEFIDGQTVENLVAGRGPLPAGDALQISRQVARALGAAAKQGVVHRDIKPANLMVVHEDEGDDEGFVVKVIDFGLARSAVASGGENSGAITMGGFVGTPQYASPEQIEENDLDVRSDIYSLGITLWYMLVGQPPFTGTVFRISSQHLTKEPPWDDIREAVAEPVRALLARMLQKDPAARPQTPAKLRLEIEDCLRRLPSAQPSQLRLGAPAVVIDDTLIPEDDDAQATVVEGPTPTEGRLFAGRYQLGSLVGEGASGQIFRAYDGRLDGKLVAVKVLHPELNLSPQAFYHLQGDLGRLRDAPHPHLIETFLLERTQGYKFSVMEWINGYPLQGLLRSRGALALRDALRLLGQAAEAAAHCSTHRLHRLELSPHKILLHFPTLNENTEAPSPASLVGRNLDDSPRFSLKIDALAPAREAARTSTRRSRGVSPRMIDRDTLTSIRGLVEGSYFYALGTLLYELLGAIPPPADKSQQGAPVQALGEAGNALLKRALSTNPGFATENEFFTALLKACNLSADEIGLSRPSGGDSPRSTARTPARLSSAEAMTFAPMQARSTEAESLVSPPSAQNLAPLAEPVAPTPAEPEPDDGGQTIAYDQAATRVPVARLEPFPPPAEARAEAAPTVRPPQVAHVGPLSQLPPAVEEAAPPPPVPAVHPTSAVPESAESPGADPAEAATFAPVEPRARVRERPVPTAKMAPSVLRPATVAPHPGPKPFPLGWALAAAAVFLVSGVVAAVTALRSHPAAKPVTPDTNRRAAGIKQAATLEPARAGDPPVLPPPVPAPVVAPTAENPPALPKVPPIRPAATPMAGGSGVNSTAPTPAEATPTRAGQPAISQPATPVPSKSTSAPTPRRDNKANVGSFTSKPNRSTPPPAKNDPPPEKPVQKTRPTPVPKQKATPQNDDDTPNFLR